MAWRMALAAFKAKGLHRAWSDAGEFALWDSGKKGSLGTSALFRLRFRRGVCCVALSGLGCVVFGGLLGVAWRWSPGVIQPPNPSCRRRSAGFASAYGFPFLFYSLLLLQPGGWLVQTWPFLSVYLAAACLG